jgi:hypothetical protein
VILVTESFGLAGTDIKGWGKTEWGMSKAQVLKVYPEARPNSGKNFAASQDSLEIQTSIAGETFNIGFFFRNGKDVMCAPVKKIIGSSLFESLEQLLTNKYGAPSLKRKTSMGIGPEYKVSWTLPSTSIELSYAPVPNMEILRIKYKAKSTAGSENL